MRLEERPRCQIIGMSARLLEAGLTDADLDAFLGLLDDPQFAALSWPFVLTRGQKPRVGDRLNVPTSWLAPRWPHPIGGVTETVIGPSTRNEGM